MQDHPKAIRSRRRALVLALAGLFVLAASLLVLPRLLIAYGAARGHTALVSCALALGFSPEMESLGGLRPLRIAAMHGQTAVMELLLAHGADPNSRSTDNSTALSVALGRPPYEGAELLLRHGADPNATGNYDLPLLRLELLWGSSDAARILLEHGANRGIIDMVLLGQTEEVSRALNENPGLIEIRGEWGYTLLHFAVEYGKPEVVPVLIAAGVPLDATSRYGDTALARAVLVGDATCVKILCEHGADPYAPRTEESSAFSIAEYQARSKPDKARREILSILTYYASIHGASKEEAQGKRVPQ